MSIFSERIKELRAKEGITQKEAAVKSDMPSRTLQDYELCKRIPTLPNLVKLAKLYDVSIDYLAGLTDERK